MAFSECIVANADVTCKRSQKSDQIPSLHQNAVWKSNKYWHNITSGCATNFKVWLARLEKNWWRIAWEEQWRQRDDKTLIYRFAWRWVSWKIKESEQIAMEISAFLIFTCWSNPAWNVAPSEIVRQVQDSPKSKPGPCTSSLLGYTDIYWSLLCLRNLLRAMLKPV